MSDPTLSDIDFKNKMALVWTTFNFIPFKTVLWNIRGNVYLPIRYNILISKYTHGNDHALKDFLFNRT